MKHGTMKKLLLTLFLFTYSFCSTAIAQNYKIDGVIEDTLGNALIASTVLLLEKADSTLVEFTSTEMDGSFRFKNIPAGNHLIKSTYLGYVPLTVDASSHDGSDVKLGVLKMTELAEELMEVVIKAAKAPIRMRGDTIEYDASTFKVPEGSTVEDLLRRLPGIEVESDGSILADGKDVNKVTVDGKSFFGSDPKAATKNLPAEGISKVQVFDTKSEQEEITGATTEAENKTMNLELKEEFKKGGFGKVIAGVGDENRKELKGNYNKFNKKIQFSLVGVGNNTGRNGLSWDDYQDFMGSNSWNFGGGEDYGFGGAGGYYTWRLGGDAGIESTIQNLFFSGEESGYPENYSTGLNFNYDHNDNKLSSVYYYNQNSILQNSTRDQDKFFQNFTQNEEMRSRADDQSSGHRVELEFEKEIDSLHTIRVNFNGSMIDDNRLYRGASSLRKDGQLTSSSNFQNDTDTEGHLINTKFLFRKSFKKKGRKMGFNAGYLSTALEDDWEQISNTDFYINGEKESELDLILLNNNIADKTVLKANALYVEPLSKRFFVQTFYNFRDRLEEGERHVQDREGSSTILNDDLSRSYENSIKFHRAGTALRYTHNGMNLSMGGAYQTFDLTGEYKAVSDAALLGTVDKTYNNFIPHISMSWNPVRNSHVSVSFNRSANEPTIDDLKPLVDNINPLYIREGNPELTPEIRNVISFRMSRNIPLHDLRMRISGSYSFIDDQFSTAQQVDERLITTATPINVDDGTEANGRASISFPIIKNKIKVRSSYSLRHSKRKTLVNDEPNNTEVLTHRPSLTIDLTPSKDYSIYLSASQSNSNTSYDINTSQDQKVLRVTYEVEVNAKLIAGIFLSSKLFYNKYTNDRFDQEQIIPIINSSIYRHFMNENQLEVRFSLYDGLNRNLGFNQSAYGISVSQSSTESLARYGMLSITYNIRGMKTDVRKNSWW